MFPVQSLPRYLIIRFEQNHGVVSQFHRKSNCYHCMNSCNSLTGTNSNVVQLSVISLLIADPTFSFPSRAYYTAALIGQRLQVSHQVLLNRISFQKLCYQKANLGSPLNRAAVFSLIDRKDSEINDPFGNDGAHQKWVQQEIDRYAQGLPFMRGVTPRHYYEYLDQKIDAEIEEEEHELTMISQTTPQQFWKAAYDFDPMRTGQPATKSELTRLLSSERLKPVLLGRLYDNLVLWLIPGPNALPQSKINASRQYWARFPAATTDSGAISYPDGHPSIDYEEGGSKYQMLIDPEEDSRLRRFCPLGWIAEKREYGWHLTGHVLVMDMDRGRDHHPWVVLASQWPSSNGDPESFVTKAPARPRRDADDVQGIFPGDKTRTPVAKLIHIGAPTASQASKPFLKQFGPDFKFTLQRKGGERIVRDSAQFREYHPRSGSCHGVVLG